MSIYVRGAKEHFLKISPRYYNDVKAGLKTFEVRFNDRDFEIGDVLHLLEYDKGKFTGRKMCRVVNYILDDPNYCKEGFVILGIFNSSFRGKKVKE